MAGIEAQFAGGVRVEAGHLLDHVLDLARAQQIGLLEEVEHDILGPGGILEALVVARRLHARLGRLAGPEAPRAVGPQLAELLHQRHLLVDEGRRILHGAQRHLAESLGHHLGMDDPEAVILGDPVGLLGHDPAPALHHLGELGRDAVGDLVTLSAFVHRHSGG